MTANPDAVFSRARKLLALAKDGGATEAEAILAAEKLQELLQDNNLTMAQVEASGGATDQTAARVKQSTKSRAMYAYQRSLMAALADNNFCLHRVVQERDEYGRKSNRHFLIGRSLNVEVTVLTYDYLVDTMKRLVRDAGYRYGETGERDLHWWLDGCAQRIIERLRERRQQREAESEAAQAPAGNGTHRELVLSDVYGSEADLNNDALNNFPPGTTAARRREADAMAARQQAEHDRLVAEGVDSTVAWYRAYGYGDEDAIRLAGNWKKRSRRRGGRGRSQTWTRADEQHHRKINSASYRAGRAAGNAIGLDDQVAQTHRRALPGSN